MVLRVRVSVISLLGWINVSHKRKEGRLAPEEPCCSGNLGRESNVGEKEMEKPL